MSLKNVIRNVLNIRTERALAPPGPKPAIGSSIVLNHLRIRLKYPITDVQWDWFTDQGWRTADMRKERRKYASVPDKILIKLITRDGAERDKLHQQLLSAKVNSEGQLVKRSSSKVNAHEGAKITSTQ